MFKFKKIKETSPSNLINHQRNEIEIENENNLIHQNHFKTYPLPSKIDISNSFSSLGKKKKHLKQNQLLNQLKSNNSSTTSLNSNQIQHLSNSISTTSSNNPSHLFTPTSHLETITYLNPNSDLHSNTQNLNQSNPQPIHPISSSSSLDSSTPRPHQNVLTTDSLATDSPPQVTHLAQNDDGDDPTILAPIGLDMSTPFPLDNATRQQFSRPQPQTFTSSTSIKSNLTSAHSNSSSSFLPTSSHAHQNRQFGPNDNQIPLRPRAFSHHMPISPSGAAFPAHNLLSKQTTTLISADHLEQVPSYAQSRLPLHLVDSASPRAFKKKRGQRLCRSKTDNSKAEGGIASALALSGVSLAPHSTPVSLSGSMQFNSSSTLGPTRPPEEIDDRSTHTNDSRHFSQTASSSNEEPFGTGYAVASRKRNAEFHAIFKSIPDDDFLIEDYGCALQRDILVQGRIYISERHVCFKANIFGWVTTLVVPFSDVVAIEKRMTALIIPNAIQVVTTQSRHIFSSFLTRDTAHDLMHTIWRITNPPGSNSSFSLNHHEINSSTLALGEGVQFENRDPSSTLSHQSNNIPQAKKREHPETQCECSPETHCKEVIWDAVYPISPEKLYNILFQSDFLKDFWVNVEHITDISVGDWTTAPDAKFPSRNVQFVRPLNAPVGPKTIKCLLLDEHLALDFDKYVSVLTTTKTPDAPAGGGFSVKSLSCITWQPNDSSRWLITAGVEWTKVNRFLKSIIESSAISGQKAHQVSVDQALRNHIRLNYAEPGLDRSETQAASAGVTSEEALLRGNESKIASVLSRDDKEIKNVGSQASSNFIVKMKHQFQAISSGTHPSWMMMASIILVAILLVMNLITVQRGNQIATTSKDEITFPGEQSHHGGKEVKPQLTGDAAEMIKEALQQYFSDHSTSPPLSNQEASKPWKHSSKPNQEGSDTESMKKPSFSRQETAEIEILLESLEQRIRNVRKSLVEERRHQ